MRFPISHITPRECAIWVGAGLAWTLADGMPGASARPHPGFALTADSVICRTTDRDRHRKSAVSAPSFKAMLAMLALCLAVSVCAGVPQTAADQGSDMQSNRDQAKWVAGIDSTQN